MTDFLKSIGTFLSRAWDALWGIDRAEAEETTVLDLPSLPEAPSEPRAGIQAGIGKPFAIDRALVDWNAERNTVQWCRYCKRIRFFDHHFQTLSIQLLSRIPKVAAE